MVVVGGKFKLGRKIGLGSFGAVYRGSNDQGEDFAIKCEPLRTKHPAVIIRIKIIQNIGWSRWNSICTLVRCAG